jgi:hypothetical protein
LTRTRLRGWGRAALLGIAVALVALPFVETPRELMNSDWAPILMGGRLVMSDPAHLYDRAAQLREQTALLGAGGFSAPGQGGLLPFVFPPWVALLAVPFAGLGPEWGGKAWILLNAVTLGGGLLLAARDRLGALAAFAGVPAALMVSNAQADGIVVLGIGAAWHLHRRGRDLPAGLALGLALAKPHLVVALAVGLIAGRRWRLLAGWAIAGGLLVVATELRDGSLLFAWLRSTAAVAGASRFEVGLPAIAWAFLPIAAPVVAALATVGVVIAAGRAPGERAAAGTAVAGGLVAALHGLGSDLTLVSGGLALAGRTQLWPLLGLSVAALAYALLHQPLVNAAVSLGLAGLVVWMGRKGSQAHQERAAPEDDG